MFPGFIIRFLGGGGLKGEHRRRKESDKERMEERIEMCIEIERQGEVEIETWVYTQMKMS